MKNGKQKINNTMKNVRHEAKLRINAKEQK